MISFELHKKLRSPSGSFTLSISSQMEQGKLMAVYGQSGAGKTSLIRMLSGLLQPDSGFVKVNNETWYDSTAGINIRPQKRSIGLVFQDYALFPNMTVHENLKFALPPRQESEIIDEIIVASELGELLNRKPNTLSGGQKQRVALSRALIRKPDLLLLDEPLSALDHHLRGKMQNYILKIHKRYGLHTILVSHLFKEVVKMSDTMVILENGKVLKQGKASEIFEVRDLGKKEHVTLQVVETLKEDGIRFVLAIINNQIVKIKLPENYIELKKGDSFPYPFSK